MQFRVEMESSGRLHCRFADGVKEAEISAYDGATSLALLEAAQKDLETDGCGECYWQMATGEYRLLLRRAENDVLRIAVLWANGIVTGWENVFWTECPLAEWNTEVHRELDMHRSRIA